MLKRKVRLFFIAAATLLLAAGCGKNETVQVNETVSDFETEDTFETLETDEFEERKNSASGKIENTITYFSALDAEKYTEESWNSFVVIFSEIYAEYLDGADDERCDELQKELEKAKSFLEFRCSEDEGNPLIFHELTVEEMVEDMGTGWNLGNTMDGHTGFSPNETLWQNVESTQRLIDAVHDMGFHTVRIPVTWGTMVADDYSINDKWISRVQDIVDYCINQDMYVIINIHHDGADQTGWLNISAEEIDFVYEKFEEVWRTIANRFRDYDEHLIFESMNEVYGEGLSVYEDNQKIMNLNQIFVNVVRSTGSNNVKRWLSVPGRYTNIAHTTGQAYGFELPKDFTENRLFVSVHYYDYRFGMEESMAVTEYKQDSIDSFAKECEKLVSTFTSKGVPVIMGEYGAVNKNNPKQRGYHNEVMNFLMKQAGIVPIYWDQGWYDRSKEPADYSFSLIDRVSGFSIEKEVTDALMRGYYTYDRNSSLEDISASPVVTCLTEINFEQEEVTLFSGEDGKLGYEVLPSKSNDVLLWKTADYSVASVYNGKVRARGIGTTYITAYSQSGSVEKSICVTVLPKESESPSSGIYVKQDSLTINVGEYQFLDAKPESEDENIFLCYRSADPNIATVSRIGKVNAVSEGETTIQIMTCDGMEVVVPIIVKDTVDDRAELSLALNVLYNDEALGYYGNEVGQSIVISTNGQYTLSFDCETDLSKEALAAGVTGLNNLTAVYMKDCEVTNGEKKDSGLVSCDIVYDSIQVDGVDLTITKKEKKSAIKSSGIFDTNDPFNSWDGSAVEEVSEENHVLNLVLEGNDTPQTVAITFTISNLVFK